MTDYIERHKASIQFVVFMVIGVAFIVAGMLNGGEPAMIALGGGVIGLPGFSVLTVGGDDES